MLRRALLPAAILAAALIPGPASPAAAAGPEELVPDPDTPVVLIVLDELPTAELMTADGRRINGIRFPNIARFARGATWYRDNVAAGDFTAWAVPGILTGNLVNELTLPTTAAQPDNFFTWLGPGRTVHNMETVTELCPVEICPDGDQGGAPGVVRADAFILAKFRPFAPNDVKQWIEGIPAGPGTLSFVHVEVPHQPLRFIPSGQAYKPGPLIMPTDTNLNGWTVGDAAVAFVQHRHLLQTGYADRIVGRILDRIEENGDFDDAMIVLTADHGISYDPDDLRRDLSPTNMGGTVNPPLLIKYPGQSEGVISTASTQSIDIYPTIARQLGVAIPPTDGQPVDEAGADRVMTVMKNQMRQQEVTAEEVRSDRRGALKDQFRRLGPGDLWHLGPRSSLIGTRSGSRPGLKGASYRLYLSDERLRRADGDNNFVPSLISGQVAGVGPGRLMALAWNGTIVATTRSFTYQGKVRFGFMVRPAVMRRGHNRINVLAAGAGGSLRRVPED